MIGLPSQGFVMLSMPKCASTSLVDLLSPKAELIFKRNSLLKHMNCSQFHAKVRPLLRSVGYMRRDYEVVSLFREPVSWLESWWRYRSRPDLLSESKDSDKYVGGLPFESFAAQYLEGADAASVVRGRPCRFIALSDNLDIGVDRLFALDRPEIWGSWLGEKLGVELDPRSFNRAPTKRDSEVSTSMRRRLEEHFAPELDVYERLRATGQWDACQGYVPTGAPG